MKNKRGMTNIEAVLSIVIFLAGVVAVVALIGPKFTEKEPPNTQLDKLEEEFREKAAFKDAVFIYTTRSLIGCGDIINQTELPNSAYITYIIYLDESKLPDVIISYDLAENEYTFPSKAEIYDYNELNSFIYDGNFKIKIKNYPELNPGKEPPLHVPINSKEIEIKIVDEDSNINEVKVILMVW